MHTRRVDEKRDANEATVLARPEENHFFWGCSPGKMLRCQLVLAYTETRLYGVSWLRVSVARLA